MKLAQRKNTTTAGLKALSELIKTFKFESDIDPVKSDNFPAKYEVRNDVCMTDRSYHEWMQYECYWQIKDGKISLMSVDNRERVSENERTDKEVGIIYCMCMDFELCLIDLSYAINAYNKLCTSKDAEIEKFLDFCSKI